MQPVSPLKTQFSGSHASRGPGISQWGIALPVPTTLQPSTPRFGLRNPLLTAWQNGVENQFIFARDAYPAGNISILDWNSSLPESSRAKLQQVKERTQEVTFPTQDGLNLYGWFTAPQPGRPTIVYAHSNAEITGHYMTAPVIYRFMQQGFGFFTFDYRGYGNSQGSPSEKGVSRDLIAACRFLKNEKETPLSSQVLLGRSLGSAVAVDVAQKLQPLALVLLSPFTSMRAAAALLKSHVHPALKYLPVEYLMTQKFDSVRKIPNITVPILILHGSRDEMFPLAMAERLRDKAISARYRELAVIPGGDHNGILYDIEQGTQVVQHIDAFLKKAAP